MKAIRAQFPEWAQQLFHPYRYKVIYGGRGAARSWSVARALLIRAAASKTRVLCTREMQSSLRDSVHQLLRDQIDLLELPGFRVMDREIRHKTGSLFLFEGLRHNVTKIKSLEGIDICWVEEAERVPHNSWQVLIPTIRKEGSEIWITFNPDQETDSTYVRFVKRRPDKSFVVHVNWNDNPWLPEELIREKDYAYSVDPESADHIWGGNLRRISAANILKDKWVIEEFVPNTAMWSGPYQGQDFGFATDPFASIRCWINDTVLYIEHESWHLHLELDDTAFQVCADIPGFEEYITRGDSARPDSISYLKRHGLPRLTGVKKHQGSVEDGIAHLRSYEKIVVHPRCIHTIEEFKRYSYKVDLRSGDILPIVIDADNHLIDSLRYALQPMIKPRRAPGFLFAEPEEKARCPICTNDLEPDGSCATCEAIDAVTTDSRLRLRGING